MDRRKKLSQICKKRKIISKNSFFSAVKNNKLMWKEKPFVAIETKSVCLNCITHLVLSDSYKPIYGSLTVFYGSIARGHSRSMSRFLGALQIFNEIFNWQMFRWKKKQIIHLKAFISIYQAKSWETRINHQLKGFTGFF